MASQTISLSSLRYTDAFAPQYGWLYETNTPLISADLSPSGITRRFYAVLFNRNNGEIRLFFTDLLNPGLGDPGGHDLSDTFESDGSIEISFSGSRVFILCGADLSETYEWTPSNSQDVRDLATALGDAAFPTGSITIRDFDPSSHTADADPTAFSLSNPEATATVTPVSDALTANADPTALSLSNPNATGTATTPTAALVLADSDDTGLEVDCKALLVASAPGTAGSDPYADFRSWWQ